LVSTQWIDLSQHWQRIALLDQERQHQKRNYASGLHLSKHSTWLVGLAGEVAVSLACGQPIDEELRPEGDNGKDFTSDFGTVDVKATTRIHSPDLVVFPDQKHWADYYVLTVVDVPNQQARIAGWATLEEIQAGDLHDYGYGPRLRLTEDELHEGLVPSMEFALEGAAP